MLYWFSMSAKQFKKLLDSIGQMELRFYQIQKYVYESQSQALQEVVKNLKQQGGYIFKRRGMKSNANLMQK